MAVSQDNVETKLSAARTRLILDRPFLGALVLRLPLIAADEKWCKSTATDARAIYYNADYIDRLTLDQTEFALAHDALHCALSHFARRMHRDRYRWDIACDLAVNPILIDEGLKPVPDALVMEDYRGMTAEEIYPCLDEHEDMNTHDDHLYDEQESSEGGSRGSGGNQGESEQGKSSGRGENPQQRPKQRQGDPEKSEESPDESQGGRGRPPPLSKEERDQLSVKWQQRLAGAAQQAQQAGKLSEPLKRMIEHLLQPQLPWRMLLARYMTVTARNDYNWSRPSRREGEAILPSLRSNEITVVVALDTSGSIIDAEMRQFVSEVNAIKGQVSARILLTACDDSLHDAGPWEFAPWEEFTLPQSFPGGGGTDFRPVFAWIDRLGRTPDLLVYFTDAIGEFPDREPTIPVIWLVKGRGQVPWGRRIQLN
jgi:predicted metal-dependent peptidase